MPSGTKNGFHRTTAVENSTVGSSAEATRSLGLTILYHPHLDRVGDRAVFADISVERPLLLSRVEPTFAPPGSAQGEPLGDEHLSRKPIRLFREPDGSVCVDCSASSTIVRVRGERIVGSLRARPEALSRGLVLELGSRVVLLLHWMGSLSGLLAGAENGEAEAERELVGESEGIERLLYEIRSVADLRVPVLLRGETGAGKELVARAIHRLSPRRDKPFVAVNLGAITATLANAELFGARKGSHATAHERHIGYFEKAHGGTLFLDEIGEAPAEVQVPLLRTLETGEIQTVGSSDMRKVDVRVIAATDADLEGQIASGKFRAPLLNRLAASEIRIPPLRDRRDDIGRLLVRFLREEMENIGESKRLLPPSADDKPWLPASLVARLADFDWPGNIRQLHNVVRQLVILNRGKARAEITKGVEELLASPSQDVATGKRPSERPNVAPPAVDKPAPPDVTRRKPADISEEELREALQACRWDLEATSKRLGISRPAMYTLKERFPWFRVATDLSVEEIRACHQECGGDLAKMAEHLEVSEKALLRRVRELGLS